MVSLVRGPRNVFDPDNVSRLLTVLPPFFHGCICGQTTTHVIRYHQKDFCRLYWPEKLDIIYLHVSSGSTIISPGPRYVALFVIYVILNNIIHIYIYMDIESWRYCSLLKQVSMHERL